MLRHLRSAALPKKSSKSRMSSPVSRQIKSTIFRRSSMGMVNQNQGLK